MVLKKAAITGASGMLGRHFGRDFSRLGILCRQISRDQRRCFDSPNGEVYEYDFKNLTTPIDLDPILGEVDAVIHCAAAVPGPNRKYTSDELHFFNVTVTSLIGEWCALKNIPMVFISGATVYADTEAAQIREDAKKVLPPLNDYGKSKWAAEIALSKIGINRLVCLRPSSLYGPWQDAGKLVTSWLKAASEGRAIDLVEPYEGRLNLVHCSDVTHATKLALDKGSSGVFNIPGPEMVSYKDLARTCIEVAKSGHIQYSKAKPVVPAPARKFDLDGRKAYVEFGYSPRISLQDGLRDILLQPGGGLN